MESAVMERPVDDSPPEFNEDEWARQMGDSGSLPSKSEQPVLASTIAEALGLPQPLEDLWPGHVYIPPKITQLEKILPLVQAMRDEYLAGNVLESLGRAVTVTQMLARRIEGDALAEVTEQEIKDRFDEDEIAEIVNHMMFKQGVLTEDAAGNAPSGRSTGLKNFVRSVAPIPDTGSSTAEN